MLLAEILPADVWAIALSIIGFLLSLQGLWLVCRALWPAAVERASGRVRDHGVACFFVGLLVSLIIISIAVAAGRRAGAPGQVLAYILLFFYLIMTGIGTSGLATHIGRGLASPIDAIQPWRRTVRGGIVLELAMLIPLFGWVGIFPVSLIIGAGSTFMGLFTAKALRAPITLEHKPEAPVVLSAGGVMQ